MKINLILAKVFKFITFVLFTFMALVYFGVLLIVPLDIMTQIIRLFHGIGLPTVIAAVLGIGGLAYLGLVVSRMPELYKLVIDVGVQLVSFGHAQIKRFDAVIDGLQQAPAGDSAT